MLLFHLIKITLPDGAQEHAGGRVAAAAERVYIHGV